MKRPLVASTPSPAFAALAVLAALAILAIASPTLAQPAGRGPGAGAASCGGTGPDLSRAASFEGTVKSLAGGPGKGRPLLVLSTPSGERTIVVAPWRALAASTLPAVGSRLALRAAPVTVNGNEEFVALSVTDLGTGLTTTLRDPATGVPLGGRGRGTCNGNGNGRGAGRNLDNACPRVPAAG